MAETIRVTNGKEVRHVQKNMQGGNYRVMADDEPHPNANEEKPLSKKNKTELKQYADEHDIGYEDDMTKEALLAQIKGA